MDFRKVLIWGLVLVLLYNTIGVLGIFILGCLYFIFFYVYKKKYYIRVISGETGSGKSLLANHLVQRYIKKNKRIDKLNKKLAHKGVEFKKYDIYSTFYIDGAKVLTEDFYNYKYPENSVLLIDESQIMFDSREHGKLTKLGISNKIKAMLSMHRHHKLDIYFITQRPEEIDAQIRRYCNDLLVIEKTIFFRRFYMILKKLKIKTKIAPILVVYKSWDNVSDYLRWYNSTNLEITPRQMGAKTKFALITRRDYETYNTYQDDSFYNSLIDVQDVYHDNPNSLIHTGVSNNSEILKK